MAYRSAVSSTGGGWRAPSVMGGLKAAALGIPRAPTPFGALGSSGGVAVGTTLGGRAGGW